MAKTTSYSMSGINPTTSLKEVLASFGYDENNMPAMWGDAVSGISSSNIIYGNNAPTKNTPANKNDFYYNTTTGILYICSNYEDIDTVTDLTGRVVVMNETISIPQENLTFDNLEYKQAGKDGEPYPYSSEYIGLQIGHRLDHAYETDWERWGFFYGTDDDTPIEYLATKTFADIWNQEMTNDEIELYRYDVYSKVGIYITGGTDADNESLVSYLKENGYVVGTGTTWVEVKPYPMTDKNFIVSGNSSGSAEYNTNGVTNLFVCQQNSGETREENYERITGQLARYSYANLVVGDSNELGDLTQSSSGSQCENIVCGRLNKLASHGSGKSSNLIVGALNNVYGAQQYCSVTVGYGNLVNTSASVCLGDRNKICVDSEEHMGIGTGGYGINIVGNDNVLTNSTSNQLVAGYGNTVNNAANVFGNSNSLIAGSTNLVVGNGNSAGQGSGILIGNSLTSSYGSSCVGTTISVSNGTLAYGRDITHFYNSSYVGGNHFLFGDRITVQKNGFNVVAVGRDIIAECPGVYIGDHLTAEVPSQGLPNAILIGRYNDIAGMKALPSSTKLVLADGTGENSDSHNLMYSDGDHNAHFSDCVFATNLPDAPSEAGTYTLQVVVDGSGNKTYSWV